ncbi:hypothetical protein O1611_g5624 [Lasiodiplodia mahajangana]|uniref:Uncharacterized protein n=1 Tax=Lasiodiplodia mahajangana TaxID=1108764 RepID=A0ACC2JKZ0_9PEZI|nr:hypothetical protein O1611_g5624 [Lasiodiplodia mahajangana]
MEQDSETSLKRILDGLKLGHLLPSPNVGLPPAPASADRDTSEQQPAVDINLFSHLDQECQFAETPVMQLPQTLAGENESSQGNLFPGSSYSELLIDSSFPLSSKLGHVLSAWDWNPLENVNPDIHSLYTAEMGPIDDNHSSVSHPFSQPNSSPSCSSDSRTDPGASDTEETKELISMLSDRMGSLQIEPSGQVRFYGPTSNFNLVDMPAPDNLTIHRTVRSDGQDCLDRLGIGATVPPDIEEHLSNLYFAWQDPAIHVVNRSVYEQAKDKWQDGEDTPYYSLALMNSICALGAAFETRYHPTFITFPRSLSDFFADRAKALLDIELDSPCPATVQALVVISGHDIGCKRDARGWLYSGMALRLAFDLSLHIDLSSYVIRGALSHEEASARRTAFWGAYTADRTWSYYLGRPSHASIRAVMLPRLDTNQCSQVTGEWIPYVQAQSFENCSLVVDLVDTTSRQRSLLWEIITPLSDAIYESTGVSYSELEEIYKKVAADLVKWKTGLDTSLQIDTEQDKSYLPHVLLLQSYSQAEPFLADARRQCIDSAIAIAKLLRIYESQYTFRRINVQAVGMTCSAALLLIFALVTGYQRPEGKELKVYLVVCFRALEEFSQAWENAKRNRDFLVLLQRNWESRSRMPNKNRRTSLNKTSVDFTGRKRARTSSNFTDITYQTMAHQQPIIIIGAGVAGLTLAQGLRSRSVAFRLFERRPRSHCSQGHRFRISEGGLSALNSVLSPQLQSLFKDTAAGKNRFEPRYVDAINLQYPKPTPVLQSESLPLDRTWVRQLLSLDLDDAIEYEKNFESYEIVDKEVHVQFTDGSVMRGRMLVGADGIRSRVRKQLQPARRLLDLERWIMWGRTPLKSEKQLPPDLLTWCMYLDDEANVQAVVEPMIWPKGAWQTSGQRLPNYDDYVYWCVCATSRQYADELPKKTIEGKREYLQRITKSWHPNLKRLFDAATLEQSACVPVISSKPDIEIRSTGQAGRVTIIGDAAHAMSAMGGSGADTAVRNAVDLARTIAEEGVTRESIEGFESRMEARAKERIEHSFRGGQKFWRGKEWTEYEEIDA